MITLENAAIFAVGFLVGWAAMGVWVWRMDQKHLKIFLSQFSYQARSDAGEEAPND